MNPREKTLKELQEYTDKELIQKKYYELRNDPVALKQYAAEIEDTVREQHILLFDFPFVHHPDLLRESDLYPHLSISHVSNVNVVRHLRYTPVFEHSHSFFTVLYVLSGQCGHTVNGMDVPMAEGDVFFLPPYAKQTISVFDDSIVLNIHIRRDTFGDYFFNVLRRNSILSNFFINSLYTTEPIQGILFHTGTNEEIRDLFLEMYREARLDDQYSWRILDNMVPILFATLLRRHSDSIEYIGEDARDKLRSQRVAILSYINDHFRTITLEELADVFHYSVPHISKLIQNEAGIGFATLVRQVRMNHATALLRNTHTPVSEISYLVGYENPESFIRAFKKEYKISPSAYRKKNVPTEE